MKKIVAIGCSALPLDLQMGCFGTLSRFIESGNDVRLLVAHEKVDEDHRKGTESAEKMIKKSCSQVGISEVIFTEKFDYTRVSQNNVNILRSYIESVNPLHTIIPFHKSHNKICRILGRSSLLACRWVENVIMYDTDRSSAFHPGIFFSLSQSEHDRKKLMIANLKENGNYAVIEDAVKKMEILDRSYSNLASVSKGFVEAFESHRVVLLSPAVKGILEHNMTMDKLSVKRMS